MIRKVFSFGIKAEALQLTFGAGAVCGMTFEAVLITVPKIAFAILGSVM
jgi:hypothetical protein